MNNSCYFKKERLEQNKKLLIFCLFHALLKVMPQKGFGLVYIILIIFIAILILGGGYYYLKVYRSAQYAKMATPLLETVRQTIQLSPSSKLKDKNDYAGAQVLLKERQQVLTQAKDQLSSFKLVPLKDKQVHEDFLTVLDWLITANNDAQKNVIFFETADKLWVLLKPEVAPESQTVGDYLNIWQVKIEPMQALAVDLFEEKPPALDDTSFNQLKTSWEYALLGYTIPLRYLQNQDRSKLYSDVTRDFTEDNLQPFLTEYDRENLDQIEKAIDEFPRLLESVLIKGTAENILRSASMPNVAQEEFGARTKRLQKYFEKKR